MALWPRPRAGMRKIAGTLLAAGLIVAMLPASVQAAPATVSWAGPSAIPSAATYDGGPALASYDGLLYAAWQGKSSPYHIWYATFSGTNWSSQADGSPIDYSVRS